MIVMISLHCRPLVYRYEYSYSTSTVPGGTAVSDPPNLVRVPVRDYIYSRVLYSYEYEIYSDYRYEYSSYSY